MQIIFDMVLYAIRMRDAANNCIDVLHLLAIIYIYVHKTMALAATESPKAKRRGYLTFIFKQSFTKSKYVSSNRLRDIGFLH